MIEVNEGNQPQAQAIFSAAFADDPVMNWIGDHHPDFVPFMFEITLPVFIPHGLTYMTEEGNGAAAWIGPDTTLKWPIGLRTLWRAGRMIGWRGLQRFSRSGRVTEQLHPAARHYYLFAIGATPDSRGQGVGTRLIREILQRCDDEGVPAYLENSKEANLGFYRGHGFEVTREVRFHDTAPPVWLMWREPRAAAPQA